MLKGGVEEVVAGELDADGFAPELLAPPVVFVALVVAPVDPDAPAPLCVPPAEVFELLVCTGMGPRLSETSVLMRSRSPRATELVLTASRPERVRPS
jgi:hypothetical protein